MRISPRQISILGKLAKGEQPGTRWGYRGDLFIDPSTDGQALAHLVRKGLIVRAMSGAYLIEPRGLDALRAATAPVQIGRPRSYSNNAERQRAYREREKARNRPQEAQAQTHRQMVIEDIQPRTEWLNF